VKVISFTDHDYFSSKFYIDIINEIKKNNLALNVLPGIELTIKSNNKKQKGHALFIFNNDINDDKLINLEKITNKIRNKFINGIPINEATLLYKDYDFVIIPHIGKGSDNLL
jgi:predicted metal-dependent phosphoesterase TrpH